MTDFTSKFDICKYAVIGWKVNKAIQIDLNYFFYSPSPSSSTAIALGYNLICSSRRWLDSTCSGPLRSSLSRWTVTSLNSGFSNGGFQPNPACLMRRDILELKGVVKPQGTAPMLVILRGAYVVSLAGTITSPSLVLSRYKPLQVPIQNTAFGCKISTAFSRPLLALRDPHHHLLSMLSSQLSVLALHLCLSSRNIRDQDVSCSFERLLSGSDNSLKNLRPLLPKAKYRSAAGPPSNALKF